MNQRDLYSLFNDDGIDGELSREILGQRNWYTRIADFDPRTGDALILGFDEVVRRLASEDNHEVIRDRLWRITDHSRAAIKRIINSLSNSPKRDQAVLPLRSVRELNAASFIALSRRPGRTIREKLSDRPYMQAVRRYQSIDLPENRLFKAFLIRLVELLEFRMSCLGDQDELVTDIHRWLHSEQANEISQWQNLSANNTLLSHRDYRRIWDAWRWLQRLDDDIEEDRRALEERRELIATWEEFARKIPEGKTLFGSMPVLFDYESFALETWCMPIQVATKDAKRSFTVKRKFTDVACIDLTYVQPMYATSDSLGASELSEQFVWQYWKGDSTATSLELFDADLVVEHPDAVTVSSRDLFFGGTAEPRLLDAAARSFSQKLSSVFTSSTLQWLYPDFLNDFELGMLRRNLNSRFPGAEPLPRSVAAVFESIDFSQINGDGFQVVVYDESDGVLHATKLIARFDSDLLERLSLTNGYYWERTPTVILRKAADPDNLKSIYSSVDQSGRVRPGSTGPDRSALQDAPLLYNDIVGEFDLPIIVHESPVQGGVRLRNLQDQAGDIPLWRDHIPELSIGALVNGLWETIPLVGAHTNVRPIRGREVEIPSREEARASLGSGVTRFVFPLSQGRSENKIGYEAFLVSPSFPLSTSTRFKLKLTYTYGADDPYKLQFLAEGKDGMRDSTIPPIIAAWRPIAKRTESELENLPLPDFEDKVAWELLTRWPRLKPRNGSMEWDLLDHIKSALSGQSGENFDSIIESIKSTRTEGVITTKSANERGQQFLFVDINGESVYCNESDFLERVSSSQITPGSKVFLNVRRKEDRSWGVNVTFSVKWSDSLETVIRGKLLKPGNKRPMNFERLGGGLMSASFPSHVVWNRGRSITESDCPAWFRTVVEDGREYAQRLLDSQDTPQELRTKILVFLSRMHKDAPQGTIQELQRLAIKSRINFIELQCLAFSIGDCSETWQQKILERILHPDFSDTVYALSIVFLKCPQVVEILSFEDLVGLISRLEDELKTELLLPPSAKSVRRCAYIFEVLLALLVTRRSDNLAIKQLLAPESSSGVFFTEMIDRVARNLRDNRLTLSSRIEMKTDEKAPDEAWQPDLLVALRTKLTGRGGSTSLRISWANESG